MIRNYLLVFFRNLARHRTYAFINIIGLAVGMACFILIAFYIITELSYDRYHHNSERIYRMETDLGLGGDPIPIATTNFPPAPAMKNDYPEVVEAVRILLRRKVLVEYEDNSFFEERVYFAENSIFDIFTLPLIRGNPATALELSNSVVITESTSRKYFGSENPIGRRITLNGKDEFAITGVMEDLPANSHFIFDMLLSFQTFADKRPGFTDSWQSYFGCFSYLLLAEKADYRELENKLPAFRDRYFGDSLDGTGVTVEFFLTPLTEIHLHSHKRHEISGNGDIMYVYIFSAVAVFILLMACINFMNIATARSMTRTREIGIRKVLGAGRSQIARQFFAESIFYALLSLVLAIALVQLALPVFNSLADRELSMSFSEMPYLITALLLLALLVGLISGSYPALLLSGYHPARVLKGGKRWSAAGGGFRKVLVVGQFTISIALIIGTFIIIAQLNYMKKQELGFDIKQLVVIPIIDRSPAQSIESIKGELKKHSGVVAVTACSHIPGGITSGGSFIPEGYPEGQSQMMNSQQIDDDYIDTMGMEIALGRNFSQDFPADVQESVLINQAAAREIGWDNPIGRKIGFSGDPDRRKWTVVGLVKDFHYVSLHSAIEPLYISREPDRFRYVIARISSNNIPATLEYLENKWKEFDTSRPFQYFFLDESFDRQYRTEEKLRSIFFNFTIIAIFIACLGLFGLSLFAAESRKREIGIRKVLGASVSGVVLLMSKDFTRLVVIANVIAWPLIWIATRRWLENFAYRTPIKLHLFLLAGVAALAVAFLTILFQAVKTARANPVEAIRYE